MEAFFINGSGSTLDITELPEALRRQFTPAPAASLSERDRLLATLWSTGWNKSKAARKLHWSRMTIYRRMAKHRLTEDAELEPRAAARYRVAPASGPTETEV